MARRDQILEVAASLFSTNGYHGTSMQHLAEGLGILRGSLYAHIDSKEDLLFEIVDRGADRFLTRMNEVAASDAPATEKLKDAIEAHVAIVAEQMDAATVFLNDWKFLTGARRRKVLEKRRRYESLVTQIVSEGIAAGALRPELDARLAARMLLSIVNWLYQWYDPKGKLSPRQIASRFGEMIVFGLADQGATR